MVKSISFSLFVLFVIATPGMCDDETVYVVPMSRSDYQMDRIIRANQQRNEQNAQALGNLGYAIGSAIRNRIEQNKINKQQEQAIEYYKLRVENARSNHPDWDLYVNTMNSISDRIGPSVLNIDPEVIYYQAKRERGDIII